MTSQINHITVDCADTYKLASFWSQVTGRAMHEDDNPGDPEAILLAPDGIGPNILFVAVPEGKTVKNRVHLDLMPVDRTRNEEVERLLGIGATVVGDHRTADGRGWVTMADPEGNEFCVERSAAERVAG
jgi:predicted enzyme related to lactoylglutathione lyase